MQRFYRSASMLPIAAFALLGALAVLTAPPAGAQSLPASEGGRGEKFQFKLPYEARKAYQLQQTLRLEARTGEYGPDDLKMDIRQVVTALVRLDANSPAGLTARIGHIVQRGDTTGRYSLMDRPEGSTPDYSNTIWQQKIAFQADLDGSGKLSNSRGSVELRKHLPAGYNTHPSVVARHARRNDWIRQIVEEPTLYLPSDSVAIGEEWTYSRTLRAFGELSIYPTKTIREQIRCRLVSVDSGPQGRIATIEISSVTGKDVPGQSYFKKAGLVRYNLDTGALVQHKLAITGTFIRSNRKLAKIKAALTVCLVPTSDRPGAVCEPTGPADLPRGLPSMDRDGEEVVVFARGTKVVQNQDGKVWTLLAKQAKRRKGDKLTKSACPVAICDPRKGIAGKAPKLSHLEVMIDQAGRAWWIYAANEMTLTWTEGGKYKTYKFEGHHSRHMIPFPKVHGVTGHNLYVDVGGEVFASGRTKLHIYDKSGWKALDLPGQLRSTHQEEVLFRRMGGTVYIACELEPSRLDARCSLLAYEDGVLCDTGIVISQQVAFLGQHEGKLLVGTNNRLWTVETIQKKPVDKQGLTPLLAKLSDKSYKVRKAAAMELEQAGRAGIEVLQEAIDESRDPEQMLWLRTALKKLKTSPSARLVPTKLGGFEALDFVFQARDGMQFYRPWKEGKLQAESFLLCINGGKKVRKIALPRPDRFFQLQLETPDGKIIGRDSQCVFELDLKTLSFRYLFALGKFAKSRSARVVAAKDGLYCLAVDGSKSSSPSTLNMWYNPAGKRKATLLPGRAITDGVSRETNLEQRPGIAPGLDGRLWLLRRTGPMQNQLAFAEGRKVTTLGPRLAKTRATLLPLKKHAVLILPEDRGSVLLHLGEKVIEKPRIKNMISENYQQMLDLVPDTTPYHTSLSWPETYLLRMGEDFWIKESFMRFIGNGCRIEDFRGLFGRRGWQNCDIERIVGIDPAGKKILAYGKGCQKLFWASSQRGSLKIEPITERNYPFGWCWYDRSNLPYYRAGMILTESAIDRMKEKLSSPDSDSKVKAEDFPGFRMWNGSGWVNWEGTLWDGGLYTDDTGGIWHIRRREATVQLKDGRRQRLVLDDVLDWKDVNLVQERPGAVWLATSQSVLRLVSDCKDGVFGPYRIERRFTTRNCGYSIRGPWIIGGKDFYFASGGVLYHASLAELLKGA